MAWRQLFSNKTEGHCEHSAKGKRWHRSAKIGLFTKHAIDQLAGGIKRFGELDCVISVCYFIYSGVFIRIKAKSQKSACNFSQAWQIQTVRLKRIDVHTAKTYSINLIIRGYHVFDIWGA
ncbi:hypothetical protein GCM10008111_14600 [Alishewanella tabrizica]|uniref:Uncharacterized protein n=1 Tax=Alishewanella tabrizica TaxID=671278 RepID=A0ABQ2WK53_9ALTE|nr:hypothetical protein GCM10008111_14600 [Alishewanella tabrizica]